MLSNISPILTFFAHPDDETLAAGATISKFTDAGATVHVAIPATGIHARKNTQTEKSRNQDLKKLRGHCYQALKILGVKKKHIYLGEFSDNEIDRHTILELIHFLEEIIAKIQPKLILTHHWRCTNIDHQYCHEAVVVATRPNTNQRIPVFCGEVPSSTGYRKPTFWDPNVFIELTSKQLERKIKAMNTYEIEARRDPHPRSPEVLKAYAKIRGAESGFLFAEAFMTHQIFWPNRLTLK